ncbi:MAG: GTPase ObgE [Deltaproteobacteria bacterium RIFOXYD2_FULL_66_9]|nr:MAG: GTPase ObgE [Deltaproteobacteria bacterium RIFOXYD2_FULL_66_9]
MHFIDEATITVRSGDGGRGCVSFRREKFVPRGGPDGGNGGNGGSVLLEVSPSLSTLLDFRYRNLFKAARGQHGMGKNMHGKGAQDRRIAVPPGTVVTDADTGEVLADLTRPGETIRVAKGGRGGRGNTAFTSSVNQAPDQAEPGRPGQERRLRLELKLIAEIGLIGLPNAGKSTLLSRISRAHPKIADYPFTTLSPVLGVVSHRDEEIVVADLPGLIEGAHRGVGLGHRFLRHAERTEGLIHLLDASQDSDGIVAAYRTIRDEMEKFGPGLAARPALLAFTKMDLTGARENAERALEEIGHPAGEIHFISAATGEGIPPLLDGMLALRKRQPNVA